MPTGYEIGAYRDLHTIAEALTRIADTLAAPDPESSPGAIDEIVEAQGWTEATLLDLALNYIDSAGGTGKFAAHLQNVARIENS